jgi:hypothetical protein
VLSAWLSSSDALSEPYDKVLELHFPDYGAQNHLFDGLVDEFRRLRIVAIVRAGDGRSHQAEMWNAVQPAETKGPLMRT